MPGRRGARSGRGWDAIPPKPARDEPLDELRPGDPERGNVPGGRRRSSSGRRTTAHGAGSDRAGADVTDADLAGDDWVGPAGDEGWAGPAGEDDLWAGTDVVGNRTRVKVVKNKVAAPFKQAEFDIMYGKGISREGSLIDVGVEQSIIRKSGAWYTYDGDQLGQGKEKAREFLKENPDVAAEVEKKILEKLGVGQTTGDAAGGVELPPVDF